MPDTNSQRLWKRNIGSKQVLLSGFHMANVSTSERT
jgi:hypothetical protein